MKMTLVSHGVGREAKARAAPNGSFRNATTADVVHLLQGQPGSAAAEASLCGPDAEGYRFAMQRVLCGSALAHEGAGADRLFLVLAGSFKCVKTAEDGYEQVLRFAGHGAVLGFDGLPQGRYDTSLIALEDSAVYVLPVHTLNSLRREVPVFDDALQMALCRELSLAAQRAAAMSPVIGDARLARFLIALSEERRQRGESPSRLLLRMSRRDIANHVGLAHETISRSFTGLVQQGCLRVNNREIEIVDLDRLHQFARCSRTSGEVSLRAEAPRRRVPAAHDGMAAAA